MIHTWHKNHALLVGENANPNKNIPGKHFSDISEIHQENITVWNSIASFKHQSPVKDMSETHPSIDEQNRLYRKTFEIVLRGVVLWHKVCHFEPINLNVSPLMREPLQFGLLATMKWVLLISRFLWKEEDCCETWRCLWLPWNDQHWDSLLLNAKRWIKGTRVLIYAWSAMGLPFALCLESMV